MRTLLTYTTHETQKFHELKHALTRESNRLLRYLITWIHSLSRTGKQRKKQITHTRQTHTHTHTRTRTRTNKSWQKIKDDCPSEFYSSEETTFKRRSSDFLYILWILFFFRFRLLRGTPNGKRQPQPYNVFYGGDVASQSFAHETPSVNLQPNFTQPFFPGTRIPMVNSNIPMLSVPSELSRSKYIRPVVPAITPNAFRTGSPMLSAYIPMLSVPPNLSQNYR